MGENEKDEGRNIKSRKKLVGFGDKAFKVQEVIWMMSRKKTYISQTQRWMKTSTWPSRGRRDHFSERIRMRKKGSTRRKAALLNVEKKEHSNGSLFFCNKYREKSKE